MSHFIDVDQFKIGGQSTYIIAEIGSNHNQSLSLAKEHIQAAKESGAHAVKFQSLSLEKLYFSPSEDIISLHKKIDLEENWHKELQAYSKSLGITFFSSPTYLEAVNILVDLEVPVFKLASAQVGTFPQLVRKVAATKKPTIISTGIATADQLQKILEIFDEETNSEVIILHCNSIYPTPYDKINLGRINYFKETFGKIVGFSDHSDGIYTAIAAVALGAKVIEKHFAIDRNLPVPDAEFSLDPPLFSQMVKAIKQTDLSIASDKREELEEEEAAFKQRILYRLVAKTTIKAGDKLQKHMIKYLRHNTGIDCRSESKFLGRKVANNIRANSLLNEFDFK